MEKFIRKVNLPKEKRQFRQVRATATCGVSCSWYESERCVEQKVEVRPGQTCIGGYTADMVKSTGAKG